MKNINFIAALLALVSVCTAIPRTGLSAGLEMALPADFRCFSKDSPWNTPISPNPNVSPSSTVMISRLKAETGYLKCSYRKWTSPIFVIDSKDAPLRDVISTGNEVHPSVDPNGDNLVEGIPIPEGVWPDPKSDGHLILVDPNLKRDWEFSRFKIKSDGSITASRIYSWDLSGPGFTKPFSGKNWWTIGAVAAGLPFIGGLIKPTEFEALKIEHALICALPNIRKSMLPDQPPELCPPAARTDGRGYGADYIPMGSRLQLDPDLDLNGLGLSAPAKAVAAAMQNYGMFVGLSSGDFKIFFQNMGPDGKYWAPFRLKEELARIPIEYFRVLDCPLVVKGK